MKKIGNIKVAISFHFIFVTAIYRKWKPEMKKRIFFLSLVERTAYEVEI